MPSWAIPAVAGPAYSVVASSMGIGRGLELRMPNAPLSFSACFVPEELQVASLIGQAKEAITELLLATTFSESCYSGFVFEGSWRAISILQADLETYFL